MSHYSTSHIEETVSIRMGEGLAGMTPVTIPTQLKKMAQQYANEEALIGVDDKVFTYEQYYKTAMQFAKSLVHVGLQRYESLNLIGFNSYHYAIGYMGCVLAGGIATGIYTTNTRRSCLYCAQSSKCRVVLLEGKKQLDKYMEIIDDFKPLAFVVYNYEEAELPASPVPIYRWETFLELGGGVSESAIEERIAQQQPGQCCALIFTSGTTGNPKAVMISHDNYIFTAHAAVMSVLGLDCKEDILRVDELFERMKIVSYLPLSHVAAQLVDFFLQLVIPLKIYFARSDALKGSLVQTLQKAQPTIHLGVPRVWEKVKDALSIKLAQGGCIKSCLTSWAMGKGHINAQNAQFGAKQQSNGCFGLAKSLVLNKVRQGLGMTHLVGGVSSAAPIHQDVIQFFADLNVPVYEIFGQSEGSGPVTSNNRKAWKIGTVGRPVEGVITKIVSGTDELIYFGRNVFMGYKDQEEATKAIIDSEGYLHTEDKGRIDSDGFVTITGRIKEIIVTAGGENVTPVFIEDHIKSLIPSLSNAVVIGNRLKFLSILLTFKSNPDGEGNPSNEMARETAALAKQIGSIASSISDIPSCPKFMSYINDQIGVFNKTLAISQAQNIRKFHVLSRDFGLNTGELTPTLKLKRNVVSEMYDKEILGMYVEGDAEK